MRAFLAGLLRVSLIAVWLALPAAAQQVVDMEAWATTADRAEEALSEGRASNVALETLRAEIAEYRTGFLDAQTVNSSRIATLQGQIDALGAAPAEGETEPEEIAARRDELTNQMTRLRAPVLAAEEAYSRADGIIREIDATIRDRQADQLLTLGPSPVNPLHWPEALEVLVEAPANVMHEVRRALSSEALIREMQVNGPFTLLLLVLALVLLWRGRTWVFKLADTLRARTTRGTGVWTFLVSVGLIALPMLGLLLLQSALMLTGLVGLRGEAVLDTVVLGGVTLLAARWLGVQLFSDRGGPALLALDERQRQRAHRHTVLLGVAIVVASFVQLAVDQEGAGEAASNVLIFPVIVFAAVILFRLGQVLLRGTAAANDEEETPFRIRAMRLIGRAAAMVALVSPVLAAIGYTQAAEALLLPAILSLALLGLIVVLQRFTSDLYRFLTRSEDAEGEGLIPTLMGFALFLAAVPVFALIWGTRLAELTELWAQFREGFQFGETRISPTDFLTFAVVFALGYAATRLLQGALRTSVLPKTRIEPGGQVAIVSGLGYVGIFLAALIAITATGLNLSSLAIVAGALSVGIGFGLQNIVSNFVSGIILLIERPISEGDWIEVGGNMGYVRSISVRSTRIETFDRTDVIVPNADFVSGTVTNYTRGNTIGRVIVRVGVAYGTDTKRVEELLRKIAEAHPMVLLNPPPNVFFMRFGADSLDFEIRAILRDVNWMMVVTSEMNHEIARVFAEEGIEIPFAQRDIWLRNPEALRGDVPGGEEPTGPTPAPGAAG